MRAKRHTFSAKLVRRPGRWVTVEVPLAISRVFGKRGSIPIKGTLDGKTPFRSTLLPTGRGVHFLSVKYELRKIAGLDVGDVVKISLELDDEPRTVPMPEDLLVVLEAEGLMDGYALIPPGARTQLVKYLEQAVQEQTRQKRLVMIIERAYAAREKQADRVLQKLARENATSDAKVTKSGPRKKK